MLTTCLTSCRFELKKENGTAWGEAVPYTLDTRIERCRTIGEGVEIAADWKANGVASQRFQRECKKARKISDSISSGYKVSCFRSELFRNQAFAMARAVSIIRQEKAHSLSYHDKTRANFPPVTLVCSAAKFDEWGS